MKGYSIKVYNKKTRRLHSSSVYGFGTKTEAQGYLAFLKTKRAFKPRFKSHNFKIVKV